MNNQLIAAICFSLIVGLGLGISLGRTINPEDKGDFTESVEMTQPAMNANLGQKDESYDLRFINAMIDHHNGAINMANDAMTKSDRPEILKMSHDIIEAQSKEIQILETWKKEWYGDK